MWLIFAKEWGRKECGVSEENCVQQIHRTSPIQENEGSRVEDGVKLKKGHVTSGGVFASSL